MTRPFDGFSSRTGYITKLPSEFFSDLLPLVDDLAELKVTLFCFWALHQKEGHYRYLIHNDFALDEALLTGLRACTPDADPLVTLAVAIEKACTRGTLLAVEALRNGETVRLYFVNTPRGRTAIHQLQTGEWKPGAAIETTEILPERPTVYKLYEDNFGPLTPLIADALKDAERSYPASWLEEAMRVAVESNARNWRYVEAVLKRWQVEGKSREVTARSDESDGRRFVSGEFADFIEH